MGLSREHHGELNKCNTSPTRFAELRKLYRNDSKALQQIDVYDPDTEYHSWIRRLIKARGEDKEALRWLKENYPDI